jgi:hypothetical protein
VVSTNGWVGNQEEFASKGHGVSRPHTISSSYERGGIHPRPLLNSQTFLPGPPHQNIEQQEKPLTNSEPVSPSRAANGLYADMQNYSTIKRSYRYSGYWVDSPIIL